MNCATTSQEDKGFNSKLVRLEVVVEAGKSVTVRLFQFQTGAIRSGTKWHDPAGVES